MKREFSFTRKLNYCCLCILVVHLCSRATSDTGVAYRAVPYINESSMIEHTCAISLRAYEGLVF